MNKLEEGMYVRTKIRGFQYPQIAKIENMTKDSGYKNQHYIALDHNLIPDYNYHIYEEDIVKSSYNIIDLIEVGDYVNGHKVVSKKDNPNKLYVEIIEIDGDGRNAIKNYSYEITSKYCYDEPDFIKSIVTKEQFEAMEYKI